MIICEAIGIFENTGDELQVTVRLFKVVSIYNPGFDPGTQGVG